MNPLYLFLSPLLPAIVSWLAGGRALVQRVLTLLSLGFSLFVLQSWQQTGLQDVAVSYPWIDSFGISISLAVNGLNYWFLVLTALVVLGGLWPTALTGFSETDTAPLALRSSDAVTVIATSTPQELNA
jgi:NADH:ubiquinone oxidoreductase subunit 4 (subunit M)